jgi:hypothetical protein
MKAFWEARRLQWSHETHVTTFSLVNDGLTDRVPTLRNFGAVHCKFLNIGDRIENCPKLQGGSILFPIFKVFFFLVEKLESLFLLVYCNSNLNNIYIYS